MNLLSEIFPSIYIGSGLNWNHFLSVILHWLALAWEPAYETNSQRKYTDITPNPVDFIVGSWWLHLRIQVRLFLTFGSGFVFFHGRIRSVFRGGWIRIRIYLTVGSRFWSGYRPSPPGSKTLEKRLSSILLDENPFYSPNTTFATLI